MLHFIHIFYMYKINRIYSQIIKNLNAIKMLYTKEKL